MYNSTFVYSARYQLENCISFERIYTGAINENNNIKNKKGNEQQKTDSIK